MLMNLANISFPNLGSGRMVRWGAAALRDMETYSFNSEGVLFLRTFGAVLGAALPTIADTGAIERAADSVIPDSGQILDAAAADQYHRVLLQVVAFAADVARHLSPVLPSYAAHLAQRRIPLLRRARLPPSAHPP